MLLVLLGLLAIPCLHLKQSHLSQAPHFVSSNMNLLSWMGAEFGQLMEAPTCEMRPVASVLRPTKAHPLLARAIARL